MKQTTGCDNPYRGIDWNSVHYLHSMSHQHAHEIDDVATESKDRLEALYKLGFRHFAISDYYPSRPCDPLGELEGVGGEFTDVGDRAVASPNAEHHSLTDHSLHFNCIGSLYATGYGKAWQVRQEEGELSVELDDLNVFDPESPSPGEGVYVMVLKLQSLAGIDPAQPAATLMVSGAAECDSRTFQVCDSGEVGERQLGAGDATSIHFRILSLPVRVTLSWDPKLTEVKRLRWMQGCQRPWRQAFREALDGTGTDQSGRRIQGLEYPGGGGITLNHPTNQPDHSVNDTLQMLDFDSRVLGIEIWSHRRWFGLNATEPHTAYCEHWDAVLRTGRRCFGFAVRDHRYLGRGRNVLLVPRWENRSPLQRRLDAELAYREGHFFCLIGAMHTDELGCGVSLGDYSTFRFTELSLERDSSGHPIAVCAAVGGNDVDRRPNLQIRFVTESGTAAVVDNQQRARFVLPRSGDGSVSARFVRVEAFAYPVTHLEGEPLSAGEFSTLDLYRIARLHDRRGDQGGSGVDAPNEEPLGIVDILLSQAFRFVDEN